MYVQNVVHRYKHMYGLDMLIYEIVQVSVRFHICLIYGNLMYIYCICVCFKKNSFSLK